MAGKPRYATRAEQLVANSAPAPCGCRVWVKAVGSHGYGAGTFRRLPFTAHRAAYEEFIGPVPEGKSVLHKCDNRRCIEPSHLFVGTDLDNSSDKVRKLRHEFGERRANAKLNNASAYIIKYAKNISQSRIAKAFGISQSTVSRIQSGKRWRLACQ